MLLNKKKAEETIKSKIAGPLGVSVEEAAILIRKIVDENMGTAIRKEIHLRGYDPRDFVLFAIGGGGPTHMAGYMGDIPTAVVFPFSPVFSAHGSSVMDVMHIYENSRRFVLMEPGTRKFGTNYDDFNGVVDLLIERATKELFATGYVTRSLMSPKERTGKVQGQWDRGLSHLTNSEISKTFVFKPT